MADENKPGASGSAGGPPEKVELTPEEKAVLLECRRQSMMRGFAAGTAFAGLTYWFKAQGRVPMFVSNYPGLFYGLGFFFAFVVGANSYRKTCFQKLMALDNSFIADKIREVGEKIKEEKEKNAHANTSGRRPAKLPPPLRTPPTRTPTPTPTPGPNVKLEEGPSINMRTYNKDRSMLETKTEQQEQPSAFSSDMAGSSPAQLPSAQQDRGAKKWKTFDEIRQENRQKHGQPSYPTSPQSPQAKSGTGERKKRNKYGDIIEE